MKSILVHLILFTELLGIPCSPLGFRTGPHGLSGVGHKVVRVHRVDLVDVARFAPAEAFWSYVERILFPLFESEPNPCMSLCARDQGEVDNLGR